MQTANVKDRPWWYTLLTLIMFLTPVFAWEWGLLLPLFFLSTFKLVDKHWLLMLLWLLILVATPFFAIQSLVVALFAVTGWMSWFESGIYLILVIILIYDMEQRRKMSKPG